MNRDTRRAGPSATAIAMGSIRWQRTIGVLLFALCAPMWVQARTHGRAAGLEGPCPFFDAAVVQKIFPSSSNEAAFKRREKPYPSCTYLWKGQHKRTMKVGQNEIKVPSAGRLTLTKAPSRVAAKDWERVLLGYRNQQLTPVPELGPYAIWSSKRRQLSWIAKGHVFHVAVEDDDQPEAQQKNAMAVAAELLRTH